MRVYTEVMASSDGVVGANGQVCPAHSPDTIVTFSARVQHHGAPRRLGPRPRTGRPQIFRQIYHRCILGEAQASLVCRSKPSLHKTSAIETHTALALSENTETKQHIYGR